MDKTAKRVVVRADDGAFRPYDRYGKPIEGMSWKNVSRDEATGQGSFLLRMDAGARSTPHEHVDFEDFYVVEGELIDADGSVFRAGDFVSFRPGSKHCSWSPGGCVLAVFLRRGNRPLAEDEAIDP